MDGGERTRWEGILEVGVNQGGWMETLFLLGRTVRLHWEHPPPFQENLGSTTTTTTATTTAAATTLFTTPEAVVRVTNGQDCSSSSSSPIRRGKKAMGMLLLLCKITMIVRRSRQTKTTGACQKTTFGTPPSPQNGTTATAAPCAFQPSRAVWRA